MSSFIYMHGLGRPMISAEDPDVVTAKIEEAEEEGDDFVRLMSHGVMAKENPKAKLPDGRIVVAVERHDSFTVLKLRHAMILAIREDHPGEVPDPAPDVDFPQGAGS